MSSQALHIPVLKREAVAALQVSEGGIYADLTLGRAGHAQEIANQMGDSGKLVAFDRDPTAIANGREVFEGDPRVSIVHSDFGHFAEQLAKNTPYRKVDGVLMDLGVSSPQLDLPERGFSFMRDGDLDMRMDTDNGETAAEWLQLVDEADLVKVLFEYGEEKFARRIARAIVETRASKPIKTTAQLSSLVEAAIPKKEKHKHPATRTFQAIRIHINQELAQIQQVLPQAVELLNEGGRLVVISFHSLEDRIVKRFIRDLSTPKLPPKHIPVSDADYEVPLKALSRAIKPSKQEIESNPRSRSSVLRIAERTSMPFVAAEHSARLVGGARG